MVQRRGTVRSAQKRTRSHLINMPQPVQHLVFGTGLTGGFLLGALMHSKVSVVAVGRESVQDQWQQGLTLTDYDEHAAKVPAPQFVDTAFGPVDILWLTVKCTATANIIESLKPFVGPHTVIVCCQNGFGSDQPLKDAFPDNALHHAIVGFNVAQIENGHLRRATEGDFVIDAELAQRFELDFGTCFMPLLISEDMLAARWAKLQLNLANAVNALANVPVKTMLEQRPYRRVIAAIMSELLRVTKRLDITLPKVSAIPGRWLPVLMRLPDPVYQLIAQSTLAIDPSARTSMWWDLHHEKTTEIDYLNGAVIQAGVELGIETPANSALRALIKQVESGAIERNWSALEFEQRVLK